MTPIPGDREALALAQLVGDQPSGATRLRTRANRAVSSMGFVRKSSAPAFEAASTCPAGWSRAVTITTGRWRVVVGLLLRRRQTSNPSMPGIITSSRTMIAQALLGRRLRDRIRPVHRPPDTSKYSSVQLGLEQLRTFGLDDHRRSGCGPTSFLAQVNGLDGTTLSTVCSSTGSVAEVEADGGKNLATEIGFDMIGFAAPLRGCAPHRPSSRRP